MTGAGGRAQGTSPTTRAAAGPLWPRLPARRDNDGVGGQIGADAPRPRTDLLPRPKVARLGVHRLGDQAFAEAELGRIEATGEGAGRPCLEIRRQPLEIGDGTGGLRRIADRAAGEEP